MKVKHLSILCLSLSLACSTHDSSEPTTAMRDGSAEGQRDGGMGADGASQESDSGHSDATTTDAGAMVSGASSSEIIGPDGGEVQLSFGALLTIPPEVVEEGTEVTMQEVQQPDIPWLEEGFIPIGQSFVITPNVVATEQMTIGFPLGALPEATEAKDVLLVVISPGIADGGLVDDQPTAERVETHPALPPSAIGDDLIQFEITGTEDVIFQLIVGVHFKSASAPDEALLDTIAFVDRPCSQSAGLLGINAPAALDDTVKVSSTLAFELALQYQTLPLPADRVALLEAAKRYKARVCWSTYQVARFYTDIGLQFDMPIPVTFAWCNAAKPNVLAKANGYGTTYFFNWPCENDWVGWPRNECQANPGCLRVNMPPPMGQALDATQIDNLEQVVAHELFHYVEDWADGDADGSFAVTSTGRLGAFTEGGADMMAELAYDSPGEFHHPDQLKLAEGAVWNQDFPYYMHMIWRWADGAQDTAHTATNSFVVRALRRVTERTAQGSDDDRVTEQDLDAVFAQMFASRPEYDRLQGLVDFASDFLFLNGIERVAESEMCPQFPDDECPDHLATDTTPDIFGERLAEVGPNHLWHDLMAHKRNTAKVNPASKMRVQNMEELPTAFSNVLLGTAADIFEIQLPPPPVDPSQRPSPIRLTLSAYDVAAGGQNQPMGNVAVRVFKKNDQDEAIGLARFETLSTNQMALSSTTLTADGDTYYVVLANGDSETARIRFEFEEIPDEGFILSGFDGHILGLDWGAATPFEDVCQQPASFADLGETYRTDIQPFHTPFEGWAVAYPYNREVRIFRRSDCQMVKAVQFPAEYGGPVALDIGEFSNVIAVATQNPNEPCAPGSIALLHLGVLDEPDQDPVLSQIPLPVGAGDLVIGDDGVGDQIFVTQPGDERECFSSFLRSVSMEDLLDSGGMADENLLRAWPIGGQSVQLPQRIATTNDRHFIGWTTGDDDGRIGVMRISDGSYWIIRSDNFTDDPFGRITDLDLFELNGQVHVYLVTAFASELWGDPFVPCLDAPLDCSGYHHVLLDSNTGDYEVLSRRVLPWQAASRIAVTRDARRAFIAYSNRRAVTVLDLGDGNLARFQIDPDTPEIMGGLSPTEIWLPRSYEP